MPNPIIDVNVKRENVLAFGIYTISNNTLKLTAQLFPLYPYETREVRLEIYENKKEVMIMAEKWNYRVIKSGTDTETYFSIQEVFYDESYRKETDKSKAASNFDYSHTIECTPGGNSIDEVKEQLTRMLGCLEEPVLEEIPASQADMDPDEAIYYESTDGGKTLQAIDLDDMLEEEEETENVDRAVKDTDPIDEKALAEEKEKEDAWENQSAEFEALDKAAAEVAKDKPKE